MSRWAELRAQLAFEDAHPRAKQGAFPLLRKLARLLPDSIAFVLFNFGSSFATADSVSEPVPGAPAPVPHLRLDTWPAHGLPYSDSVADELTFGGYELVDDPLFAMRELHRVGRNGARLTLELRGRWCDPLQKRVATREALAPFVEDSARARELGVSGLFRLLDFHEQHATLEVVKGAGIAHPHRIDLGCGPNKRAGFTGIDILALPGVDIVRDVDRDGLPFSDDTIAAVHSAHFLEHVRDLVFVMNEIHRVCTYGAIVTLVVPTLLGPWAAADPTHVRLFNARSFGYFTGGEAPGYAGITARFELLAQEVDTEVRVTLRAVKSSGTRAI
jgi:hypothetical protein